MWKESESSWDQKQLHYLCKFGLEKICKKKISYSLILIFF